MYEGHGENVRLILKTGDRNQALPQQSGYPTLSKAGKQGRLKLGFAQKSRHIDFSVYAKE